MGNGLIYETWDPGKRREFLNGWETVLKEKDPEKLRQVLYEIEDRGSPDWDPAFSQVAGRLLKYFEITEQIQRRIVCGSGLSEVIFLQLLRGESP